MTFSVLGRDSSEVGVLTMSHVWAVGNVVPAARPGVGAAATQALTAPWYGVKLLDAIDAGADPAECLAELLATDPRAVFRQAACLPAFGPPVAYTGAAVVGATTHVMGDDLVIVGNMLADDVAGPVVQALEDASGPLADRLLAAATVAVRLGGDARGEQAAALQVVPRVAPEVPPAFVMDVRVDDHPRALEELRRLVELGRRTAEMHALIPTALSVADAPRAAEAFAALEGTLGAGNHEPRLWRAVATAVSGDDDLAAQLLSEVDPDGRLARLAVALRRRASHTATPRHRNDETSAQGVEVRVDDPGEAAL